MRIMWAALLGLPLAYGASFYEPAESVLWRDGGARLAAAAPELSVLSYNVNGLPDWVLDNDPSASMPHIGRLAGSYNIALFQEDYAHHAALAEAAPHALAARGNGPRSPLLKLVPFLCGSCGSGLSVMADIARESFVELEREPFGDCAGWFENKNDCWANKGYMRLRFRAAAGALIDVYTLHLEAGHGEDDRVVREAQLERLAGVIAERSAGLAVIVGGDFNHNWNRHSERAALTAFMAELGLSDAQAWNDQGGYSWRVDYILYRGSADLALEVVEAGQAPGFRANGMPLSNHPPIGARFRLHPAAGAPS